MYIHVIYSMYTGMRACSCMCVGVPASVSAIFLRARAEETDTRRH